MVSGTSMSNDFWYQYAQWFLVSVCPMVSGTSMSNDFWYQYAQWFLVSVCPIMLSGTIMSNGLWNQYAQWFVVTLYPMVSGNSMPKSFWLQYAQTNHTHIHTLPQPHNGKQIGFQFKPTISINCVAVFIVICDPFSPDNEHIQHQ